MPFLNVAVVRVLIASPVDTETARRVIRHAVEDWNGLNAEDLRVVLLPVMWERDATPEMGDRPQAILNRQLVDVADVLVAAFRTRLGTPTGQAESGTAEEIDRFIDAGKPVLVYFSSEPVTLESVDIQEYKRLQKFRERLKSLGLFDSYGSESELYGKATSALTRTIRNHFRNLLGHSVTELDSSLTETASDPRRPRASILARIETDREISGFSRQGKPRYRSRERLMVENRGDAAAENLSLRFAVPNGVDGEPPRTFGDETPIRKLPPGGSVEFPSLTNGRTALEWEIHFNWFEDGEEYKDYQSMR